MNIEHSKTELSADNAECRARLHVFTNTFQPVRRAWLKAAAEVANGSETSFAVATAIVLIAREGDGLQQNALAEVAGVNPAAMLRTLVQAEAAGLCKRCTVPENRRIKVIHLLPKGHAMARLIEERLDCLRVELLGDIDAAEIETAMRILRLLEKRILARMGQPLT